jgi:hypothetical protein
MGDLKMNRATTVARIAVLLLALAGSLACGISSQELMATHEALLRPTMELAAWETAKPEIVTAVSATLTATPVTQKVVLMSSHRRFVTASGDRTGWLLRQEQELTDCGWFTLQHLENDKVSLMTCHSRYVTAPRTGGPRKDWLLWQEEELDDCGKFILHDLGRDGVALETCADKFVTAGDGNWPDELRWSLVGETDKLGDWERFTMLERYPPMAVIADFDDCSGLTDHGLPSGVVENPGLGDRADVSFVREPGYSCIARLEYNMAGATGFWLELGDADLSPYSQIEFDIRLGSLEDAPEQYRIELKRSNLQEVSTVPITGVTTDWHTLSVNLGDFEPSLTSLQEMEELVFMFEANGVEKTGMVYLDNIALRRASGNP